MTTQRSLRLMFCLLVLGAALAPAQVTTLNGNVSDMLTGPLAPGTTYHAVGNLTVPAGETWTIGSGVVLKFAIGTSLLVDGTLMADNAIFTTYRDDSVGTDLTGAGTSVGVVGDWVRILLRDGADASQLNNCEVRFAGRSGFAAVNFMQCDATLTNVRIRDVGGDGFDLNGQSFPTMSSCDVQGANVAYNGLSINALPGFNNNAAQNNRTRNIPLVTTAQVDRNLVLSPSQTIGGVLEFTAQITVPAGLSLTLLGGLDLKLRTGVGATIDGTLSVPGGTPVRVTSDTDDSVGGDTNLDAGNSVPVPGTWVRFLFSDTSDASDVRDMRFTYGGRSGFPALQLNQADIHLERVTVDLTAGPCMDLAIQSRPTVQDCDFRGGTLAVTSVALQAVPGFSGCMASQNSVGDYLQVQSAALTAPLTVALDNLINGVMVCTSINIGPAATLTLESGVVVKFQVGAALDADGPLITQGTGGAPVVFTALADDAILGDTNKDGGASVATPGWWVRLNLRAGASASQLTHTLLRFGGRSGFSALQLSQADIVADHVEIERCAGDALALSSNSFPTVTDCRFDMNAGIPMDDVPFLALAGFSGNSAAGNATSNTIYADSFFLTSSLTLGLDNVINGELRLRSSATIAAGGVLTLLPGFVIKQDVGSNWTVNGTLNVQGTAAAPVVFTSLDDDDHGADTLNNGAAALPVPGHWTRMQFMPGSDNSLIEYGLFRYLGRSGLSAIQVSSASPTFMNCRVERVGGACFDASTNATPTVARCAFDNGARSIVNVPPHAVEGFLRNTATGNASGNAMHISPSQLTTNARWGTQNFPNGEAAVLSPHLDVQAGELILDAGVVLKFPPGGQLFVRAGAGLTVNGSGYRPVVLTATADDAFGGDSAGDGSASVPTPGWTSGLRCFVGALSDGLRHLRVRYAGRSGFPAVDIDAPIACHSLRIDASAGDGLSIDDSPEALRNIVVQGAAGTGIHLRSGLFDLVHATVTDCSGNGIRAEAAWTGEVWSTISWGNGVANYLGVPTTSIFASNGSAAAAGAGGNQNVDPEFLDAVNGDLTLAFTSPMINAADLTRGFDTLHDARDGSRVVDSRLDGNMLPDIGAYEFLPYLLDVVGEPQAGSVLYFTVVGLPGDMAIFVGPVDGTFVFPPYGIGLTGLLPSSGILQVGRVFDVVPIFLPDDPSLYGVEAAVQAVGLADMFYPRGSFTEVFRGRITR